MKSRGILVVLSGPSGAGKNSLLNAVLPHVPNLRYSVSVTTRPPRAGEQEGIHYFFVDDHTFDEMVQANELLEWAEFCGNRYGTPRRFVTECLDRGESVITDLDIQGARQIRRNHPDGVFVFLLPPSLSELKKRLTLRGTEGDDAISRRLETALEELRAIVDYDYWVLNDSLDRAASDLEAIIRAERSRVGRIDPNSFGYDVTKGFLSDVWCHQEG